MTPQAFTDKTSTDIQSTLNEHRVFDPPSDFSSKAHIKTMADYERLYEEADRDPETFWGQIARELDWFEPWTRCSNGTCRGRSGSSAAR